MTAARLILAATALASLGGCAGERAMRGTSAATAAILSDYRQGLSTFADGQAALDAADQDRLGRLGDDAARDRSEIESRLLGWRIAGDRAALDRFRAMSAVGADEILAPGGPVNPRAPAVPSAPSFDTGPVDALIKQLLTLRDKPSFAERANDAIAFTAALRKDYDDDVAKAAKDAADAAAAARHATPGQAR